MLVAVVAVVMLVTCMAVTMVLLVAPVAVVLLVVPVAVVMLVAQREPFAFLSCQLLLSCLALEFFFVSAYSRIIIITILSRFNAYPPIPEYVIMHPLLLV